MKILNYLKKLIFPSIVALSALSVSASAAFYSVTGLSKLFAGATLEVIIMASSLELSKLVIASLLYQQWNTLNKLLRTYLTTSVLILILITSMGIYGFLSAAYQETANKSGIIDKQIEVLDVKRGRFIENRDYYLNEKKSLDESIGSLRDGLANNKIQYRDRETGQIITTTSSSNRKVFERQLDEAISSRDKISIKLEQVTDSITNIDLQILDIESNSDVASELGPLKYLSELTNYPMNKIINYLLLIIIFVFDPLAISLVIAANFLFSKIKNEEENELEENEKISNKFEVEDTEGNVEIYEIKNTNTEVSEVEDEEVSEVEDEEVSEVEDEEEVEEKVIKVETEYTEVEQTEENIITEKVIPNKSRRLVYQKRDA